MPARRAVIPLAAVVSGMRALRVIWRRMGEMAMVVREREIEKLEKLILRFLPEASTVCSVV